MGVVGQGTTHPVHDFLPDLIEFFIGKSKKVISIKLMCGVFHSGQHPTDEPPEFVHGAKL